MAEPRSAAGLFVLAGVNGAGKSSLLGALLTQLGVDWFDPDAVARRLRALDPPLAPADANAAAWQEGRRLLERAVGQRRCFRLAHQATAQKVEDRLAGRGRARCCQFHSAAVANGPAISTHGLNVTFDFGAMWLRYFPGAAGSCTSGAGAFI